MRGSSVLGAGAAGVQADAALAAPPPCVSRAGCARLDRPTHRRPPARPTRAPAAVDGVFEEGGEEEETDELVGQVRRWQGRGPAAAGAGRACQLGMPSTNRPLRVPMWCRCWTRSASTSTPPSSRRRGRRWRRRRPRRQQRNPSCSHWAPMVRGARARCCRALGAACAADLRRPLLCARHPARSASPWCCRWRRRRWRCTGGRRARLG